MSARIPSFLLLTDSQLGHPPLAEDECDDELFMHRSRRTSLTAEADDPSRPQPMCHQCARAFAIGAVAQAGFMVLEEAGRWICDPARMP